VLRACAAALEEAHADRRRAEALERQDVLERAARTFPSPYVLDDTAVRQQARWLADHAVETATTATRRAAAALHELAPPPPDRSLTARQQLIGVGRGAVDAVWGTLVLAAGLSPPRALVDRDGWLAQVRALREGLSYAAGHPREAGTAMLGLDLLQDGRYGEWAGGFAPDLLSGVATGGAVPAARRGLDVAGDLEELADDVAVLARRIDVNAGGPVERRDGADVPGDYVQHIQDLTPERRRHILDGEGDGRRGGHRHGTGNRGKTEFPAHWTDDEIIQRVMETAMRPGAGKWNPEHKSFNVTAEYDGVVVVVAVRPPGEIVSAFPEPGGRGVVKNPW
jgi:hypothetical protein